MPRFILFICSTELCISTRRCFIGWRLRYDGIFCHFKANPGECRMYVSKLGDICGLQSQPSTRAPCMSYLQSDPYLLPNCCHVTIRHSNLIERTCSYVVRNRMNGSSVYLGYTICLLKQPTYKYDHWYRNNMTFGHGESESLFRFCTTNPSSPFHSCKCSNICCSETLLIRKPTKMTGTDKDNL